MRSLLAVAVMAMVVSGLAMQGCHDPGGGPDAGPDGGECLEPTGLEGWNGSPPLMLSGTGLYQDIGTRTLADGVRTFAPSYELWSDGAQKTRWVKLPPCGAIDTSDMDHWVMPVGTRLWKEFAVGGQVVETRLIARTGTSGAGDGWLFAAYQWDAQGSASDAHLVSGGVPNANGTDHDIPSVSQCGLCHGTLPEHVLGFSAIQLTHASAGNAEVTLESLAAGGKLSAAPADGGYPVPGDAVTARALGYLHANCGNCHHPAGIAFDTTPFSLRLEVGQRTPQETSAYLTAVGVPVEKYFRTGITDRIAPGNPDASCVSARISQRGPGEQMPPLATEYVDDAGVAAVNAWIRSL
jgi:hypothetical protein